jgi:hypothetical protein
LEAILERAKTAALSQAEYDTLHAAMETLIYLTQELEKNRVSVQRLKQLLFGTTTEKTQKVMEKILDEADKENNSGDDAAEGKDTEARRKPQRTQAPIRSVCRTSPSRAGMPARIAKKALSMRRPNPAAWCGSGVRRL